MHIGLEAEGRLKGVPTLNLTADEFINKTYERVTAPYGNIYITDLENILDLDTIDKERNPLVDPILSIERTKVDRQYPNINIIIYADVPIMMLKDTDQIKVHSGQNVWMISKESMIKSTPEDFEGDFSV